MASVTIPDDGGRYDVVAELTVHGHVRSAISGADAQVVAAITQDAGGGPAVVSGGHLHLFKVASGNDDTQLDQAIQVHHRQAALAGVNYSYAAAIELNESGAGADATLDADSTIGVERKHSLRVEVRRRP